MAMSKSAGPKGGSTSASSTNKFPNTRGMTIPRGNVASGGTMPTAVGTGGNNSAGSGKVVSAGQMPSGGSPVGRGPGAPSGNTMPTEYSGGSTNGISPRVTRSRVK